jgi:hypothetical protein
MCGLSLSRSSIHKDLGESLLSTINPTTKTLRREAKSCDESDEDEAGGERVVRLSILVDSHCRDRWPIP